MLGYQRVYEILGEPPKSTWFFITLCSFIAKWNVWKPTLKTASHTFETLWNHTKPRKCLTIKRKVMGSSRWTSLAMACSPRMRWCRCCRWWGLGSCQSSYSCRKTKVNSVWTLLKYPEVTQFPSGNSSWQYLAMGNPISPKWWSSTWFWSARFLSGTCLHGNCFIFATGGFYMELILQRCEYCNSLTET